MNMTLEHVGDILNKKNWQPKLDSFEDLPIRPSVKQTRLYLDNEYFEKGYGATFPDSTTAVYCILAKYAHHEKQICFPAAKTIMGLCGITNRSTVFGAFKILEAYNIIAIIRRSRGRVPNVYALLETSHWTSLNSLLFETVIQRIKKPRTVSIKQGQQSQNHPLNNDTDETRIHLTDSDKEIRKKIEEKKEEPFRVEAVDTLESKELLGRLSSPNKSLLMGYFAEEDIIAALREIPEREKIIDYKSVLAALKKRGAIPTKELPSWIRQ